MLAPIEISWPSIGSGTWSASRIRWQTDETGSGRGRRRPSRIANSSPPRRAATSPARTQLRTRSATATSSRSPATWPSVSLTTLKSSRSTKRTTGSRSGVGSTSRSSTCSTKRLRLREAGQRVVVGLVAELLLEPRQLGQRLLELAVLERDRGLVGERLEQPQVVVAERRALGQPVGDLDRADHAGLAAERRRPSPGGRRPLRVADCRARGRTRAAPSRTRRADRVVRREPDRHHHGRRLAPSARRRPAARRRRPTRG